MKTSRIMLGVVVVCAVAGSAFAATINGFGDIGLGQRDPNGHTVAGTGEQGNFLYLEFTASAPLQLVTAKWHFTGSPTYNDLGDSSFVPWLKNGSIPAGPLVSPFPTATGLTQEWGVNFNGNFNSGDHFMLGYDLDHANGSSIFGGIDFSGGTLEVIFSDGTDLTAAFGPNIPGEIYFDGPPAVGNYRATFSVVSPLALTGPALLPNGTFQFRVTTTPGASLQVLASTDPTLPLIQWVVLGMMTETPPGQYLYTDLQASSHPGRFYIVRSQ